MKYTESSFQNSGSFKGKVDKKTLNQEKKNTLLGVDRYIRAWLEVLRSDKFVSANKMKKK